jgi:hypothetical protein
VWLRAWLCILQKRGTRIAAASDKVYQLLVHGWWFSLGTLASSTTKTECHDIAEILLKVALNTINQIKSIGYGKIYSTIASISTKQKITSHLKSLNKKKKETLMYDVGNQVLAWSRHRQVKLANGIPNPPLLITGSPKAIYIQENDKKNLQIGFYSKRPHTCTITKMNANINMDSTGWVQ